MSSQTPFDLEARQRVEQIILLTDVFKVFKMNEARLLHLCRAVSEPGEGREHAIKDSKGFFLNCICDVHNYLGAVWMLKEHTIALANRLYKNTSFRKEYRQKSTEVFGGSCAVRFLNDLRNYSVHCNVPMPGMSFSFDDQGYEVMRVTIDCEILLEWTKWDKLSRAYIESSESSIDVQNLVLEYSKLVDTFYDWLSERQFELHHTELHEYARQEAYIEAIKRRLSEAVSKAQEVQ